MASDNDVVKFTVTEGRDLHTISEEPNFVTKVLFAGRPEINDGDIIEVVRPTRYHSLRVKVEESTNHNALGYLWVTHVTGRCYPKDVTPLSQPVDGQGADAHVDEAACDSGSVGEI